MQTTRRLFDGRTIVAVDEAEQKLLSGNLSDASRARIERQSEFEQYERVGMMDGGQQSNAFDEFGQQGVGDGLGELWDVHGFAQQLTY